MCSTGEGLWNVLAEGLKCQGRRLAFILKASGGFEAQKSHVHIWLFTFKCGITIASCLLQSLIHSFEYFLSSRYVFWDWMPRGESDEIPVLENLQDLWGGRHKSLYYPIKSVMFPIRTLGNLGLRGGKD